jgi:hypothetical protein
MTTPSDPGAELGTSTPLSSLVLAAHQRIRQLVTAAEDFRGPSPIVHERWSAASTVLSTHLAAMERAVYPAAIKHSPGGRARVAGQLRAARAVALAIRDLEHQLSGDFFGRQGSLALSEQALRPVLRGYLDGERELVRNLVAALTEQQGRAVANRLAAAQQVGASRPHPHVPMRWPFAGVAFWFNRNWDSMLDVLDNRVAGERQPRQTVPVGRWGHYLTGLPMSPPKPRPQPQPQVKGGDDRAGQRRSGPSGRSDSGPPRV